MDKYKLLFSVTLIVLIIFFIPAFFSTSQSHSINTSIKNQKNYSWNLEAINLASSWDITRGNNATVAIIGYGIDAKNKYVKDHITDSWNFVNDSEKVIDENGHDTFAAGIVLSIAPEASLINIKVFEGTREVGKIDEAIDYAASRGADIILMPITVLDPPPTPEYVDRAQASIIKAYSRGVKFVIGAQGRGNSLSRRFPGYLEGVYNIAGVDENNYHSINSTANDLSFVSAPCENIEGIDTKGDWQNTGGTSWSSAHLAGIVALMVSANPLLERKDIKEILVSNAIDLGPEGKDIYYGWGLADCYNSVKASRDILVYKVFQPYYIKGFNYSLSFNKLY
ncbi:MAG: S8 family peptidase [Actinomycetota bacterium]